jgi:hypothetical protein
LDFATGTWGMDFVSSSPLFSTIPPFFKFSYKSFLFQNFKKTLGFPNQGERYGAKYENGVAYLLSYTVSVEKMWKPLKKHNSRRIIS